MLRRLTAALVLFACMFLVTRARADEPGSGAPPPAPGSKVMTIGAALMVSGYGLSLVSAGLCGADCPGRAKQAVPFVGYGLYLSDEDRMAKQARDDAAEQEKRARGDGCKNSVVGCGVNDTLTDIGDVLAWVPTAVQFTGAIVFLVGLGSYVSATPSAPQTSSWSPQLRSVPGGAALGIGGTF